MYSVLPCVLRNTPYSVLGIINAELVGVFCYRYVLPGADVPPADLFSFLFLGPAPGRSAPGYPPHSLPLPPRMDDVGAGRGLVTDGEAKFHPTLPAGTEVHKYAVCSCSSVYHSSEAREGDEARVGSPITRFPALACHDSYTDTHSLAVSHPLEAAVLRARVTDAAGGQRREAPPLPNGATASPPAWRVC